MAKAKKPGQAPKAKSSKAGSTPQPPPQQAPPAVSDAPANLPTDNASMYGGTGPARTSHREMIQLPVGFELPNGQLAKDAEVRAVTGADELFIGMSAQYNRNPNDLVYKTLLLSRCITKIGPKNNISMSDVGSMHALDVRALEYAVYRLTYGEENLPPEEPGPGG
jgi:hypothetical protein